MSEKKNLFLIIILLGLFLSIFNNFYQISKYDRYEISTDEKENHSMIKGDIIDYWSEGQKIKTDIQSGKNYFETGGEYRRPYLPSRIVFLFTSLFKKNFIENDKEKKVNIDKKKIFFLIFQSILYFTSIIFLINILKQFFPNKITIFICFFLCFEPTIFFFHSSFWSESIFFSLQIFVIGLIFYLDKNPNKILVYLCLGILIGFLYLQRSVAIFYFFIILLFFLFNVKKNYKGILSLFLGYIFILILLGFHNYKRADVFYITSTQAKDGFYYYFVPQILADKNKSSYSIEKKKLDEVVKKWIDKNNLDLNNEKDKIKYYNYQSKIAFKKIFENYDFAIKLWIKKTVHFLVIDPLSHVYYFHKYEYKSKPEYNYYKSKDHQKWILPRIFYTLFIYIVSFFCLFNTNVLPKKYLFLFILSTIYFTLVQSWIGNTRYFSPNLIYISFLFSFGLDKIISLIDKKNEFFK